MAPPSDPDASTGAKSVQPDHGFRYIPLRRGSADGAVGRRPVVELPGVLAARGEEPEAVAYARMCWSGVRAEWGQLESGVAAGGDVGVLAAASGLVVVDCDVKVLDADGWVVSGGVAVRSEGRAVSGVEDLEREVERLGHAMPELATYTVSTKSGGRHLYFKANPDYPLTTRHHRQDWRVDVIASDNSWVAAPPTPGYRVVDGRAPVDLPDWLAVFLYGINQALAPLDARVRGLWRDLRASRGEWDSEAGMPALRPGESLHARLARWVLEGVAASNHAGGWNTAVYRASRELLEQGWPEEQVRRMVLGAAAPTDQAEERKADATISSAVRGFRGGV